MFKNKMLPIVAFLGMFNIAQAGVIVSIENSGVLSSTRSGVTTLDFESGTCAGYVSCSGDYQIRLNSNGSVNQSAAPYKATPLGERWLTVPNPYASGSASFKTETKNDYFGLFWGSVDKYNTISFLNNGIQVASFGGGDIDGLVSNGGQQTWASNRFVNFDFTGGSMFDEIVFKSTNFAFESDNHAFAKLGGPVNGSSGGPVTSVSEPGTLALLGMVLGGLFLRSRKKIAS
jgi:hypothetical protein